MKILIVDDKITILETLEELLSDEHEIVCLNDSNKVLDVLDSTYNLIISDYNMPNLDGISLIDIVKNQYDIKVILMSGGEVSDERYTILQKPFSIKNLKNKIRGVM